MVADSDDADTDEVGPIVESAFVYSITLHLPFPALEVLLCVSVHDCCLLPW